VPPIPLGIYDAEDDIPGVESIRLPDAAISRWIRDATAFAERLEDALPGSSHIFTRGL
jgi:hypothetical protein